MSSSTFSIDLLSRPPRPTQTLLVFAGLIALICLVAVGLLGCSTTKVVLADNSPAIPETKGFPRCAEDGVLVIIDQTGEVGPMENSAGKYLVTKGELLQLLEDSKWREEHEGK